jgi:thymidylate synthase
MKDNIANGVFQTCVNALDSAPEFVSRPRGMEVKERKAAQYVVPMPAYLDLVEREVNTSFMFAEAAWILSGSNRVSEISPYMAGYAKYSDDGEQMSGAYGPKITDQWNYIVKTLTEDQDSRQAYLNIWRERPGESRDIPCTVGMQFLIRNEKLHMIATMRSNDVVLGLTYDIFTFSMVANAIRLKLKKQGIIVELGDLTVQPGSLHLYERHYKDVERFKDAKDRDQAIGKRVLEVMKAEDLDDLIRLLWDQAHDAKFYPEKYRED